MTLGLASAPLAQSPPARVPSARLIRVPAMALPSLADSNSPAIWERIEGRQRLVVLTSEGGKTVRHEGEDGSRLTALGEVSIENHPGHGVWFEAIVPDVDGTWYGFYHNELPAHVCNDPRTIPRIGAARSRDFGATWQNLGVVLASSPRSHDCASANQYFVGGVGDFSVMLDDAQRYLYFFFSQYAARDTVQGVSVARLAWADRDTPTGKVSVWLRNQTWLPARGFKNLAGGMGYLYPDGAPIYPVADGWHDGTTVDAFWGPSVHWNSYLQQYVMLLNRARDAAWTQEGVYVAFSPNLSEPAAWSAPQRLIAGGRWYPQVLGTEVGTGTDRLAGERARFFMSGRSEYVIQFAR